MADAALITGNILSAAVQNADTGATGVAVGDNCTSITRITSDSKVDSDSWEIVSNGAAYYYNATIASLVAVSPSTAYYFSAWIKNVGTGTNNFQFGIVWYTSADAFISYVNTTNVAATVDGAWHPTVETVTSPSNAAKATIIIQMAGTQSASDKFRADYLCVRTTSGQPALPGGTSGGPGPGVIPPIATPVTSPLVTRTNVLDSGWQNKTSPPVPGGPATYFRTRRRKTFTTTQGTATLPVTADDGWYAKCDGTIVSGTLNWVERSGATAGSAVFPVMPGNHEIEVSYFNNAGTSTCTIGDLTVASSTPSGTAVRTTGWLIEGWSLTAGDTYPPSIPARAPDLLLDNYGTLGWNTTQGSPMAGLPNDYFILRARKDFNYVAGSLTGTFTDQSDDGVRRWIGPSGGALNAGGSLTAGTLLLNQWQDQAATTFTTTVGSGTITAGTHTTMIQYYERAGASVLAASDFTPTGTPVPPPGGGTITGDNGFIHFWGSGDPHGPTAANCAGRIYATFNPWMATGWTDEAKRLQPGLKTFQYMKANEVGTPIGSNTWPTGEIGFGGQPRQDTTNAALIAYMVTQVTASHAAGFDGIFLDNIDGGGTSLECIQAMLTQAHSLGMIFGGNLVVDLNTSWAYQMVDLCDFTQCEFWRTGADNDGVGYWSGGRDVKENAWAAYSISKGKQWWALSGAGSANGSVITVTDWPAFVAQGGVSSGYGLFCATKSPNYWGDLYWPVNYYDP